MTYQHATATLTSTAPGRPWPGRIAGWLWLLSITWLLYWGWQHRDRQYFDPEQGLGYALGIVGGSLMLMLMLYPLRKRLKPMRRWGAVRHWFRMHMLFGIAGPLAILYHCNFHLGAINSNVALLSMLVVAASGLIGRFLYAQIHRGLYGRQLNLEELRDAWEHTCQDLPHGLQALNARLQRYEAPLRTPYRGTTKALVLLALSRLRRWRIAHQAKRDLRDMDARLRPLLQRRLAAAAAVYRFNASERLFALWHLLHMPLFVMLVITGSIHVLAVHIY